MIDRVSSSPSCPSTNALIASSSRCKVAEIGSVLTLAKEFRRPWTIARIASIFLSVPGRDMFTYGLLRPAIFPPLLFQSFRSLPSTQHSGRGLPSQGPDKFRSRLLTIHASYPNRSGNDPRPCGKPSRASASRSIHARGPTELFHRAFLAAGTNVEWATPALRRCARSRAASNHRHDSKATAASRGHQGRRALHRAQKLSPIDNARAPRLPPSSLRPGAPEP